MLFTGSSRLIHRRLAAGLAVLSMGALMACSKSGGGASASQVVAKVNDQEISIHQVQAMVEAQPKLVQQLGEQTSERVLDSLIEQELAAQAAKQVGLDQTPAVVQTLVLSQREVLARAYQDQLASKAPMPNDRDVEQYYQSHPELFEKRRLYRLQEVAISAPAAELAELKVQVQSAKSVDAVNALLQKSGLSQSARQSDQWAESVPMNLLKQLAGKQAGESVWVDRPDGSGAVVVSIVSTEAGPVALAQARSAIREAVWALRRKQAVQEGMKVLREQAKITRQAVGASRPASSGS